MIAVNDPVTLTLTASGGGYAGVMHSVTVTITDDDVAAIAAPVSVAVTENGSSDLPVALVSQPTANVTVTVSGHARHGPDASPADIDLYDHDLEYPAAGAAGSSRRR